MRRRSQRFSPRAIGVVFVVVAVVSFVALLFAGPGTRLLQRHTLVRADFNTIGGLRAGAPVRVAGVEVGAVASVDFLHVRYACDPLTEDVGRHGDGRTDDCDDALFCTPVSLCGQLEPWAGKGEHHRCTTGEDCAEDEVCVTSAFRHQAAHVEWFGPVGVCARFSTTHFRAQVMMRVHHKAMGEIRRDSRAMVSSASALGGKLVDISAGRGPALDDDHRIQTRASFAEEIDRLRARIDRLTVEADDTLVALASVIDQLSEPEVMHALRSWFVHIERITSSLAGGEGVVGAMLNDPAFERNFGATVSALRRTGEGLERTAAHAGGIGRTLGKQVEPVLADAERALEELDALVAALQDPSNQSVVAMLLRAEGSTLAPDLEALLANLHATTASLNEAMGAIEDGRGTVGKLVNDEAVSDDVGRLLHNLARRDLLRTLVLIYLQSQGYHIEESRDPAYTRPKP